MPGRDFGGIAATLRSMQEPDPGSNSYPSPIATSDANYWKIVIDWIITGLLILLVIFVPIPLGSTQYWAFSFMELTILTVISLWAVSRILEEMALSKRDCTERSRGRSAKCESMGRGSSSTAIISAAILSLFLGIVCLQWIELPASWVNFLSPRTFELRSILNPASGSLQRMQLSFFPLSTKKELIKWLAFAGLFLFLLLWKSPVERKAMNGVVFGVLIVAVFESFMGLLLFFGVPRKLTFFEVLGNVYPAAGTFINRNHFAGYMSMAIPFSVGYILSRYEKRRHNGWRQYLSSFDGKCLILWFAVVLMVIGLIFSASRMGIMSLFVSFGIAYLLLRAFTDKAVFAKRIILTGGLALLWAGWIGIGGVLDRFLGLTDDMGVRWSIWKDTLKILRDFPVLGTGLGTFRYVFPMYRSFHIRGIVTHAENDYLQIASEVGVLGFSILLILFVFLFSRGISTIGRSSMFEQRWRLVKFGCLVGILGIMLQSQVERNLQIPANAFLYTILWGFLLRKPWADERLYYVA